MSNTCEWGKLTVHQLRSELAKVGAKTTGRKAELLERLEAYQRNSNFLGPSVILPESNPMPEWPQEGFKSLTAENHSVIAQIREQQVHNYIIRWQGLEAELSQNISAIKNGRSMTNSVEAISFLKSQDLVFFSGMVQASMRKRVSYNFKLIIKNSGEIQNSHCECPAGKGPNSTCKHIVAVGLVLSDFVRTGEICLLKSCTEILQTFQRPRKAHNGSPVRVEALWPKNPWIRRDPRLPKVRNRSGYVHEVKTIFNSKNEENIPD